MAQNKSDKKWKTQCRWGEPVSHNIFIFFKNVFEGHWEILG